MRLKNAGKIAVFLLLLFICVQAFGHLGRMQGEEETRLVRDAVLKATMTCYAVEGAYPDSLDYLKENYKLSYNEDRYFVTYDSFASNRIPDIYVTERGAGLP